MTTPSKKEKRRRRIFSHQRFFIHYIPSDDDGDGEGVWGTDESGSFIFWISILMRLWIIYSQALRGCLFAYSLAHIFLLAFSHSLLYVDKVKSNSFYDIREWSEEEVKYDKTSLFRHGHTRTISCVFYW